MANTDGILFGVLPASATGEAQINLGRCMTLPRYTTGSDPYAGYIKITPVAESTAMEVFTSGTACFGVVDFSQLDVADKAALGTIYLDGSALSDVPIVTGLTNLVRLDLQNNDLTEAPNVDGLTNIANLNLFGNAITTAEINTVLIEVDSWGTSNGFMPINGGTNGSPSGAGVTAYDNLIGRGWTLTD